MGIIILIGLPFWNYIKESVKQLRKLSEASKPKSCYLGPKSC